MAQRITAFARLQPGLYWRRTFADEGGCTPIGFAIEEPHTHWRSSRNSPRSRPLSIDPTRRSRDQLPDPYSTPQAHRFFVDSMSFING
jgi:hypothetical protein